MAIRTRDEILNAIKTRAGDDTSDETLSFIEDVTDTLNDYDTKLAGQTDWKQKYEDNDKQWRQKYRDRFFEGDDDKGREPTGKGTDPYEPEPKKPRKFSDLFTFTNKKG